MFFQQLWVFQGCWWQQGVCLSIFKTETLLRFSCTDCLLGCSVRMVKQKNSLCSCDEKKSISECTPHSKWNSSCFKSSSSRNDLLGSTALEKKMEMWCQKEIGNKKNWLLRRREKKKKACPISQYFLLRLQAVLAWNLEWNESKESTWQP